MAQNPSLKLEEDLKNSTKMFRTRISMQHPYYFSSNPPPCLNVNLEHLRYIKYQPFLERDVFGTIQECKSLADAERHWKTQKMYDSRVLIHPQECVRHLNKYILVFEKIIRDFKFWVEEHANGRVTDEDMWEILKKIGNNLIYLCSKNRPHGNLSGGIAITTDRRPLFLNLGAHTHALVYQSDVKALNAILQEVEAKLHDSKIREHVKRWISFLSTTCFNVKPKEFSPTSLIYPLYSPDHVKLVFNHPNSWDVENKLRFLANMYKLCTDKGLPQCNLMSSGRFIASLRATYSNWPARVTSGVSGLHEVYQFGLRNGQYTRLEPFTNTTVVSEESIVIFAHDCVRHHCQGVQHYNNDPSHTIQLAELISSEILAELYTQYPYLIEDIYGAFHKALAGGYAHSTFTVAQILTGRL